MLNGYQLTMTAGPGTIYYTTNGESDPRVIGGGVNPSAAVQIYGGPININGPTTVKARLLTSTGQWSGLVEATFTMNMAPGDYDNNGMVDESDYLVWRSNFGMSMVPGTSADGTGDGMVDTADYLLWRKNLGAAMGAGINGLGSSAAITATELSSMENLSTSNGDTASHALLPTLDGNVEAPYPAVHSPIRRTTSEPVSQFGHDLLLLAAIWSDNSLGETASIALGHDAGDEITHTSDDTIAQSAWDEAFDTLADVTDSRLSGLCSAAM